jgi:hypothetical protein
MKLSYLYGSRVGDWLRLLADNRFRISRRHAPRAALITLMSLHNSWMHRRESSVDLSGVSVREPLFILGHWRSGTTHLQYLMSQDPRFASPSTYEVCFPSSFLCSEEGHGRLLSSFLPHERLQDSMAFGMFVPNEDEIALAALGLPSPYLYWAFPEREEHYSRYLSFRDVDPAEREAFVTGFDTYLRKLTLKHRRTLLLKSPTHTARVRLLLQMYPDARFVHIHRNPYDVLRSTLHLYETWYETFAFIQDVDRSRTIDRIFETYTAMHDCLIEDEPLIPEGRYHVVRFEDLEADPMAELQVLYDAFSLDAFPEGRLQRYVDSVRRYSKNAYEPLDPALRDRVTHEWSRSFELWGYSPDPQEACSDRVA